MEAPSPSVPWGFCQCSAGLLTSAEGAVDFLKSAFSKQTEMVLWNWYLWFSLFMETLKEFALACTLKCSWKIAVVIFTLLHFNIIQHMETNGSDCWTAMVTQSPTAKTAHFKMVHIG